MPVTLSVLTNAISEMSRNKSFVHVAEIPSAAPYCGMDGTIQDDSGDWCLG